MYKNFFIILIIAFSKCIYGQVNNLTPNNSFEQFTVCPTNLSQIYYSFPWNDCMNGNGSSDFEHLCTSNTTILADIYLNQLPRTGLGYSSIILFGNYMFDEYREYLEVELIEKLKENKKYCGKFYVSLNNFANYAIENIGMYFSKILVIQPTLMANLPFIPQIQNGNGIIKDTMNWVKVSGSFIASGDEKFLVIGNFYSNQFTNFLLVGGSSNPRYFVDDVSVCDCDDFKPKLGKDTTLCVGQQLLLKANVPKEADSVIYTWQDGSKDSTYLVTQPGTYWVSAYIEDYKITVTDSIRVNYTECNTPQLWIPNSFTPNGDGLNDKFEYGNAENYEIKTTIYNRWGQLIFESENTDFWDGKYKGKTVTFGTYIYHIEAIRKDTMEKKIHCGRITVL